MWRVSRCGVVRLDRRNKSPRAVRVLWMFAIVGVLLTLTFASPAGASSTGQMRAIVTRVHVRHGHLPAQALRALRAAARAAADSHRARVAIVGGSEIAITQAPWQVLVIALLPETEEALLCGGSILNAAEVLTAGHCVYNPNTRARIPADQIGVLAGTADFAVVETEEQFSPASEVRVHPYYVYNPAATTTAPDDVAVLKLEKSLTLKSTAESIAPVTAGSLPQEGAAVN